MLNQGVINRNSIGCFNQHVEGGGRGEAGGSQGEAGGGVNGVNRVLARGLD